VFVFVFTCNRRDVYQREILAILRRWFFCDDVETVRLMQPLQVCIEAMMMAVNTSFLGLDDDVAGRQRRRSSTTTANNNNDDDDDERARIVVVAALLGLAELLGADHHSLTSSTKIIHNLYPLCENEIGNTIRLVIY